MNAAIRICLLIVSAAAACGGIAMTETDAGIVDCAHPPPHEAYCDGRLVIDAGPPEQPCVADGGGDGTLNYDDNGNLICVPKPYILWEIR